MLEIKNLHAKVEDKDILNGVNLSVNAGEVHAIIKTKVMMLKIHDATGFDTIYRIYRKI